MFRYHKRQLKSARLLKHANHNKSDNAEKKFGGTGTRFVAVCEYGKPDRDRFSEKHEGQTLESALHDRTRWRSSKRKDKTKRYQLFAKTNKFSL